MLAAPHRLIPDIRDGNGRHAMDPRPLTDEQAIERYRYMLRTAPPEAIEQAHAEAFARLTESQRRAVLQGLKEVTPPREQGAAATSGDPQSLARMATRAEVRQPGILERLFGGAQGGPGLGSMLAGSLLGSIAGTVLGSMVAQHFLAGSAAGSAPLGYGDQSEFDDADSKDTALAGRGRPGAAGFESEDVDADLGDDFDDLGGDDMDIEV
jgi:hypothetical protein